ncbi:hypothetical protein [Cupriavidus necator]|uniref:hypothetical protein n=1 Tax=Cupriavidus necator TaxID=106590 RepID=UPI0005B35FBD|nr:hypothetical protein [Cupriavidus necator]
MFRINMLSRILGAATPLPDHPADQAPAVQPAEPAIAAVHAANATPTAPAAPSAPSGTPEQFARNLKTQGDAMIQYGARLLVMRELLFAMSAGLPPAARASVERRFRQRVDQLLALTDDRALPGEFHDTLLAEINYYLGELKT